MKKLYFYLFCIGVLMTGRSLAQGNGKTYVFVFKMTKGQQFTYRTGMDMNVDQSIMGQDVHVNTRFGMNWRFAVVGDSAGWMKVEAVFDRMLIHVNANGQNVDMDTDSAGSAEGSMGATSKALNSLIGQKFYCTINEKGQVGSVSGLKEIGERVKANMSSMGPGADGMAQVFNEESFRQNLGRSFDAFPKKAVAIGESWKATMQTVNNGVPMTTDATYTLQSVNGDIATIKSSGTVKAADGATVQGMPVTMNGNFEGSTDFELSSGLPVNGTSDVKTDMKIDVQGQTIPVKMDMKITTVGKKM